MAHSTVATPMSSLVPRALVIPFDEIVAGSTVRVAVIKGVQYLSVKDITMHVCDTDENQATEKWRRMSQEQKTELQAYCLNFKFPDSHQKERVITFPGALKMSMFLPGEKAKMHRSSMVAILTRYFAGDPSLLREIEANAVSESPVAQMARASLASDSGIQDSLKRKREEELEATELHTKKLSNVSLFATTMALINPNWRDDARLRLQTEDWLKNVAFNSGATQAAITNGPVRQPISVSQVAQELGYRLSRADLIKAGVSTAAKYRFKYDSDPPTHAQWVDGAQRMVKSYTEEDRDLILEALGEQGFH